VQRDIFSVASSLYHHHRVLVSVHVHQHPTAPQPLHPKPSPEVSNVNPHSQWGRP
jgi:hypothetical protein